MAIKDRLVALKFLTAAAAAATAAIACALYLGPRFSTVVDFFWPLLLSTGFFFGIVAILFRISPPPRADVTSCRASKELIDFVVAGPHSEQLCADQEPPGPPSRG
ncbi:hypothetical protein AXF42_Ash011531 [Apostasia shenzhenica]|uniref:Uncharacterized protein n=1 Tax=Apostasia shenzhenica TaxID=1088818 RepID=A0A2I0BAY9_9ASPA|nr:hypothetical protein AXF42_Ash011531 [Apostasia shenzhenica]